LKKWRKLLFELELAVLAAGARGRKAGVRRGKAALRRQKEAARKERRYPHDG